MTKFQHSIFRNKQMRFVSLFLVLISCANTKQSATIQNSNTLAKSEFSINNTQNWEVHFSPNNGCTTAIVNLINSAQSDILVQAYGFTSKPIADALISAGKAGKNVKIILDKSNKSAINSKTNYILSESVKVYIDSKHQIAHNKVIIIDHKIVETGSFNYTNAAEKNNAENCLIIKDSKLAEKYELNWSSHLDHSSKI